MMSISSETERLDTQWLEYPANLQHYDSLAMDGAVCVERVDGLSDVLFSKGTKLEVIESSVGSELVRKSMDSEGELDKFLGRREVLSLQVLSVSQKHSLSPLEISKSSLLKTLSRYQISPEFLDVICGFGDKQMTSDEVSEWGVYNSFDGSTYEISYQLRYMERNKRSRGDPWSLRQTGVYHKYSGLGTSSANNLWFLLHPMPNSKVQMRLGKASSAEIGAKNMETDPLRLHLLITSSYVDNWRLYLHDMTRQFLELEDNLLTSELRDREEYTTLNFDSLQTLRHMAGKLMPIPSVLQASIKTILAIKAMNKLFAAPRSEAVPPASLSNAEKTAYHLENCEIRLQSYLASCGVLQARIENMTKFLADGLNLQNQEISAESNGHLVTLTKDTVDDSATVRAVTFVTLIYLPATFISGLLGSNLFSFQSNTNFQISHQFWIYMALTVPLTVLTLGYWKYKTHQQEKKRARDATAQKADIV